MSADELRHGPVAAAIRRHRLIAVLRRVEPRQRLLGLVDGLSAAGVRCFEITFDGARAAGDLAAVREHLTRGGGGNHVVGAGTVLRREQLDAAAAAGAAFAVAPVLDIAVFERALAIGLPFIPGAMTPTEIRSAWDAGATFVKVFPASAVGPSFVRELRGPLPGVELVPTGGIGASNAAAFLDAGAVAVGIGGALVHGDDVERRAIVEAVRGAGR